MQSGDIAAVAYTQKRLIYALFLGYVAGAKDAALNENGDAIYVIISDTLMRG